MKTLLTPKTKYLIFTGLLFAFILFFSQIIYPISVSAQAIIFEDDFSNGFDKWYLQNGRWDMWEIVGSGEQAQATVESRGKVTQLVPNDANWPDEVLNYEYTIEYEPIRGADRNIGFGFRNYSNWYEVHFVPGFTEMTGFTDSRQRLTVRSAYVLENGRKYTIKIRFESGHIQVWVDDEQIFDAVDRWFTGTNAGRVMLRAGTGYVSPTVVKFDSIVVRDLDKPIETRLPVTMFKQSDPIWKGEEYDSGNVWSDRPTISRWGCAMSSAAMLLDYYGLVNFPDGLDYLVDSEHPSSSDVAVNPGSLNTWLKNQPDGYFGKGNLNWQAVTRLSQLISESHSTDETRLPKLEYGRVNSSGGSINTQLLTAANEIMDSKPIIFQIDGHFLVGSGIVGRFSQGDGSVDDIYIHDPAYQYDKFRQHSKSVLSTRLLTPSFTDLSYIMAVVPDGFDVRLLDEDGSEITGAESFTEYLHPDEIDEVIDPLGDLMGGFINMDEKTDSYQVVELAKPETRFFTVEVFQKVGEGDSGGDANDGDATSDANNIFEVKPFDVEIYAYDEFANPTVFKQGGWIGDNTKRFVIDYKKDSESVINPEVSWDSLKIDADNLYLARVISKWYVWQRLDEVVGYADGYVLDVENEVVQYSDEEVQDNQVRYLDLLKGELEFFEQYLSVEGFEYLRGQVDVFEMIL